MSPGMAPNFDDGPNPRPLKRGRRDDHSHGRDSEETQYQQPSPPLDHIFISESLSSSKKAPGKKAPLSCCECRRLKLKCDRSFPCGSCRKRGVADICPGVLVSGKGTRFILANTEQLHTKIHEMSDRIRHLEEALQNYNSNHPLLEGEQLNVKRTMGLYGNAQTGTGTESAPLPTDSSHRMNVDEQLPPASTVSMPCTEISGNPKNTRLEAEIKRLSTSFPLADEAAEPNVPLRAYIRSQLPSRREAEYLWEQAKQNALWQYNPHPNETFFPNLLHHCYEIPIEELSSRRLALIFMILAIGCLVDLDREPDSPLAEDYHVLARAALCETSVMEDTDVETITALFYEIWYLLVFSDKKKAAGYAWGIMGLTAKLAQSIGLHRNGNKSKVIPEEVEKRRSLFWELLYLDARLSLSLGRPPSLSLAHMDCQRPSYLPISGDEESESLQYYQEWKHSCYVHCLAPVLDAISQPALEYSTVLALDRKIREFSIPLPFKHGNPPPNNRSMIMQKASLATALEAVLLQLHRPFFTRAVSGTETAFNRSHMYAPSVVAIFLSASRMIATIQDLYQREAALTARILGYWSNAFSATVALCLLVSRAPFTCLSPACLQEIERSRALFNSAKAICPRAVQVVPVLETMVSKANDIYTRWSNGQEVPTIVLRHTDDSWYNPSSMLQPQTTSDSFQGCHRSLIQCIAEVHERGKLLFPLRKPCQCASRVTGPVPSSPESCPPSHSWAPPPKIAHTVPVLPELYLSNLSRGVVACRGSAVPPLSPTSRFAMQDTLNFELGALNPSTDLSWMAWF